MIDIEKLEQLPFKESRKEYLVRKYGDMYNLSKFDYPYLRSDSSIYPWVIARRVIHKFLGKSFDDAFSYYCTKVKKHQQSDFLYFFEKSYGMWNEYVVDENKNIQINKEYRRRWRKSSKITFRSADYQEGYINLRTGNIYTRRSQDYNYISLFFVKNDMVSFPYKRIVVSGFEKEFESKKDKEYIRLNAEKIIQLKRFKRIRKKQDKLKEYNFLTDKEMELKKLKKMRE